MPNDGYVSFLSAPTFVWWDVTNRCNFSCLHCYSNSGLCKPNADELKFNEAAKLIRELSEAGVFYIYFLGGEPFIRSDFMDILTVAQQEHIGVMINTNGWFIDEITARRLKDLGVHQVRVSLDGAFEDTHDSFRNKLGSFKKAVNAIRNLLKVGIPNVGVVSTISRHNINEVDCLIDLAASLGAHNIQCVPLSKSGRGRDNFSRLGLLVEDNIRLRYILERKHSQFLGKTNVYSVDGVFENPCTRHVHMGLAKPDFMGCRAGRTACNINYNGDVIPCLLVREPVAGNIRSKSFKEIWDHSPVFESFRRKRSDHAECRDCKWNDVCVRECPASPSQEQVSGEMRKARIQNIEQVWKETGRSCRVGTSCIRTC